MTDSDRDARAFGPNASIVLVGCRGAGKRTLGFMGAFHLRRGLVIEDHCFEKMTGMSRGKYLLAYGKESFSRRSMNVFKHMLDSNRTGCVIVCGMSSLVEEAQVALRAYSRTNPVVYIHREKEQISRLLDAGDAEQLLRADESHRQCSNLEYYNLLDDASISHSGTSTPTIDGRQHRPSKLLAARDDFNKFLDCITGRDTIRAWRENPFSINAIPPEHRSYSYALRLRLSYLLDMDLAWEDFEARADCVEFVIDTWPEDLTVLVARQAALIRRNIGVPIIYHVEENPRGERKRSPEEKLRIDSELYELGLRLGLEYLSVDLQRDEALVNPVIRHKGCSKVMGNYWYTGFGALPWADEGQIDNYKKAQAIGCDIVRMVRFCTGNTPVALLETFKERVRTTIPNPKPPLVAYDFSVLGVRTPLQSRVLNPVKHPRMRNDREQLATVSTYKNSFELLFRQFLLDPLQFHVVGANVSYSLSPAMQTAAYEFCGMPHTFTAMTCSSLDELNQICVGDSFGGACLTAPFKVAILPHLTMKSHHAEAIGAVNVVLPLRGELVALSRGLVATGEVESATMLDHANARNKAGRARAFYGDNTDWSSILTCLRRAISPRNHVQPSRTTALVIGAGGMARAAIYALVHLGCRNIFIYNRTVANAEAVAAHFNSWSHAALGKAQQQNQLQPPQDICHVLSSLSQSWPQEYQPPTLIISCVPATSVHGNPPADFEMPLQWLESPTGGVVMELAYEPLFTPLVAQMQAFKETVAPSWALVDGLEMVSEMAIEAFELQTGRPAPKRLMRDVCRRTWEQHQRDISSSFTESIR